MNDLISEIKKNVSISSVLGKMGITPNSSNKIPSIYHKEKTASLQIYFDTNSFFDYSKNIGGDVIKLYQDYYAITTKEAIKELAEFAGISNQSFSNSNNSSGQKPLKEKIGFELLESEKYLFDERAGIYEFDGELIKDEAEKKAYELIIAEREKIQINIYQTLFEYCDSDGIGELEYNYLTGVNRGLQESILKEFKIFAINNCNETIEYLKELFTKEQLLVSGLFTKKDYFIFTKHRIVIPFIEDGVIKYLRGRYFYRGESVSKDGFGKYIGLSNFATNLTSKRFFNKDILNNLIPYSNLVITEGEFDCMVAHQGCVNAIGISGVSSFPKDSIKELFFHNIFLAFDSDSPEEKAAYEIAKLFDKPVKIIKIKNYNDITELLTNEK